MTGQHIQIPNLAERVNENIHDREVLLKELSKIVLDAKKTPSELGESSVIQAIEWLGEIGGEDAAIPLIEIFDGLEHSILSKS